MTTSRQLMRLGAVCINRQKSYIWCLVWLSNTTCSGQITWSKRLRPERHASVARAFHPEAIHLVDGSFHRWVVRWGEPPSPQIARPWACVRRIGWSTRQTVPREAGHAHRSAIGKAVGRKAKRAAWARSSSMLVVEGGIRTRGGLLTHTRFPGVRLKPLIHLSVEDAHSSTVFPE